MRSGLVLRYTKLLILVITSNNNTLVLYVARIHQTPASDKVNPSSIFRSYYMKQKKVGKLKIELSSVEMTPLNYEDISVATNVCLPSKQHACHALSNDTQLLKKMCFFFFPPWVVLFTSRSLTKCFFLFPSTVKIVGPRPLTSTLRAHESVAL